jgi:hypothetical protein
MKKIIYLLFAFMMLGSLSFAQNTPQQAQKAAAGKKKRGAENVNASKAGAAQQTAAQPAPQQKLKKDGTPDMRYKENKQKKDAAKPAGPLKKDGTPDLRHKANKEAAGKK